jgi:hypothetical protein
MACNSSKAQIGRTAPLYERERSNCGERQTDREQLVHGNHCRRRVVHVFGRLDNVQFHPFRAARRAAAWWLSCVCRKNWPKPIRLDKA